MTQHFDSTIGSTYAASDLSTDWARHVATQEIAESALRILIEIYGERAQGVLDEVEKAAKARYLPSRAVLSEITFIVDRARLAVPIRGRS